MNLVLRLIAVHTLQLRYWLNGVLLTYPSTLLWTSIEVVQVSNSLEAEKLHVTVEGAIKFDLDVNMDPEFIAVLQI